MIKDKLVFITGDTHGRVIERIEAILMVNPEIKPSDIIIIIVGDAGINYWLNKTDKKNKEKINEYGCIIYCVRGNHEERPENIDTYELVYDENVCGEIYIESEFPNIRFFTDGGIYKIKEYDVLTIGGAYSIDKWYRLQRHGIFNENHHDYTNSKKTGWFPDELLTPEEMNNIGNRVAGKHFDFVLSHTSPISWEPKDLFLDFVDQSSVNKSMELFLENIKDNINWSIWIFGHYHANRIERPFVEQYFEYFEDIETIWERWNKYEIEGELDWWLRKSPNFYMGVDK